MDTAPAYVATTCVIGGNGFIGRAVVDALLREQRRVVVIGRRLLEIDRPGVTYVQHVPTDGPATLADVLREADEIINLAYATVPQTSFQNPVNDILLNLPDAVQLFELAASLPIRKFVCVSSGGTVYGRTNAPLITEEHPTLPLSPYGITKLATEKYAHMYFESRGLPVVCVRPSNAFGPHQRPYVGQGFIATAIASILDGRTISIYGEHGTIRDYLHVADMASGIVAALRDGIPGEVYNISSGQGLTNKQVLDAIAPLADAAKKPMRIEFLPPRPFDVPANVLNNSKLGLVSGWQPALTFSEALRHTWQWYVAHS